MLLDPGVPVINMQRWDHPVGDYPYAEPVGCSSVDAAVKDQLDLTGSAEVQVLANYLFKQHSAGHGPVHHPCQRELRLQDRDPAAIAGPTVGRAVRVRQQPQALAQQAVDSGGAESIADDLRAFEIFAAPDSAIQSLELDPFLLQFLFRVFMPNGRYGRLTQESVRSINSSSLKSSSQWSISRNVA